MSGQNCYLLPNGCTYCEAVDAVPGSPARYDDVAIEGWDAGARSRTELPADCFTEFEVDQSVGVLIGLTDSVTFDPTDPATIHHGFYLWTQGGTRLGQVYEFGAPAGPVFTHEPGDVFGIYRTGLDVQYRVDQNPHYNSHIDSTGDLIVGCCLFMTGDTVL